MATLLNPNFRAALWTGENLQLTLMSIPVGGEIGLESHPNLDQFLRLEQGFGQVMMGASEDRLNYQANVTEGYAIFIPAGTYHNLINIGNMPIKIYSIYAPPQHPAGTIHETKAIADAQEEHN
jgi:mannose-6-phosphate isomerase-like protein (cupin superfamily)